MKCPSCGGTTRKHAMCGRCRADRDRWARLAEKLREAREKAEAAKGEAKC